MAVAEVFAILRADTKEFTAKLDAAERQVKKLAKAGGDGMEKFAAVGKTALQGVSAAAITAGVYAVDMASKYDDAQASLTAAFKANGVNLAEANKVTKQADASLVNYGYNQTQVAQSLQQLTVAHQPLNQAMRDETLAANIAAAKHIDLASATMLVIKASEGQTRALKQAGIDLPVAAGGALKVKQAQDALAKAQAAANAIIAKTPDATNPASKAHATYETALAKVQAAQTKLSNTQKAGSDIVAALSSRYSGQASAAAGTMTGQIDKAKAQFQNMAVVIGEKLIPIITKVTSFLLKHKDVLMAVAVVIGTVVVAAIATYIAEVVAATASTIAVGVAATAAGIAAAAAWLIALGPIGLVIAAIVAVVAAIVAIYENWSTVRKWFAEGWNFIKGLFADGINWIKSHWELILAIITGPIGLAVLFIKNHWDEIRKDVSRLIEDITGFFGRLPGRIVAVLGNLVSTIWGQMKNTVSWLESNVWNPVSGWFTSLPGKIGNAITAGMGAIGGIGKSLVNDIVGAINDAINLLNSATSHLPLGLGSTLHIPDIPKLATGGPLAAGQMALVGEQGPELFMPAAAGTIVPNNAIGGNGGGVAEITTNLVIDGQVLASAVQTHLLRKNRAVPTLGFS